MGADKCVADTLSLQLWRAGLRSSDDVLVVDHRPSINGSEALLVRAESLYRQEVSIHPDLNLNREG